METVQVPLKDLKHADYNPRKITKDEFSQIEKSITKFGFVQPLVVNRAEGREGVIIGGNQRFEVAKKMGMDTVPVCYVDIADLNAEKELNIRLNKNQAGWDYDIMKEQFQFDSLLDWGFAKFEIENIFPTEVKEDNYTGVPADAKAIPGSVYQLGPHRLVCGDSTNPLHVDALFKGASAPVRQCL